MYKTVRQGENCLQYTILPQEDGLVNVKPGKSRKKGKTAAILTVTVILICGIIATAVLVPLLLTSDLVVLPFQKFSVSSLRRSHSGNHIVVVAKKPHGWISPHRNPVHPPVANKTYINAYKELLNTTTSTTTSTTPATTPTTKTTQTTEASTTAMSNEIDGHKVDDRKMSADGDGLRNYDEKFTEEPVGRNYLDISTTTRSSKGNEFPGDGVIRILNTDIRTTSSPWYDRGWSFRDTVPNIRWSGAKTPGNFLVMVGCPAIGLLCLVGVVVWMRRLRNRRKDANKSSTDDPKADDKDTLLKESTAGSEEE